MFNPESVAINREYGGYTYQTADGSYSWTEPDIGGPSSLFLPPAVLAIPQGANARATYHTHAALALRFDNESFLQADLDGDKLLDIDGYLGAPGGRSSITTLKPGKCQLWELLITRGSLGTVASELLFL